MAASNPAIEYVVKLGTAIDNEGINQILSFFTSSKMKALGLTAAITGATTAIYKFVEASTKREFELAKLAKQQHKSLQLTRAENNAMKAMGKTMAEINKDQNLKKIYKDIVAFNKELKLPDARQALDKVRELEGAFMKVKATINTAVQWINSQILINLERPIDRITGKTQGIAEWLRDNMKNYAPKIATVLSDFARGVMGVFEAGGKLLEWLNDLPPAIKNVGTMVLWLIALFKGGTIGRIFALITLIGDVMRDYDNYQWNKENNGDVHTLGDGVWGVLEDETLSGEEKASRIARNVVSMISSALDKAFTDFNMNDIFGEGSEGDKKGIIGKISEWFDNEQNQESLSKLGSSILGFITRGIRTVGGTAGGVIGKIINGIFGDVTAEQIYADVDGTAATTLATGIGGYLLATIDEIKRNGFGPGSLTKGIGTGLFGAIIGAITSNIKQDEKTGKFNIDWASVIGDLSSFGETFLNIVTEAIGAVEDVGQIIFNAIGDALLNGGTGTPGKGNSFDALSNAFKVLGEDKGLGDALSAGIATWFATGSVLGGIVGGIAEAIKFVAEDPETNGPELVRQIKELGQNLVFFLFGGENENGVKFDGILQSLTSTLSTLWEEIAPYLEPLKEGLTTFFDGIWEAITEKLGVMLETLWIGIYNKYISGTVLGDLIGDPNKSVIEEKDGKFTAKDTRGREVELTPEQAKFFQFNENKQWDENGSGRYNFAIDENGKIYGTNGMSWMDAKYLGEHASFSGKIIAEQEEAQREYDRLVEESREKLAPKNMDKANKPLPERTPEEISRIKAEIDWDRENMEAQDRMNAQGGGFAVEDIDVDAIESSLGSVASEATNASENGIAPLGDKAGTAAESVSIMAEASKVAAEAIETAATKISQVKIPASVGGEGKEPGKAFGGRIGSAGHFLVGEDGPEYIVPVNKPGRAIELINQALSEMGMGTIGKISNDFGIGGSASFGTLGNSLESLLGGIGGGSTNISAPINIYVTATGADGKEIGEGAYDAAERHLMKTLRGVYA